MQRELGDFVMVARMGSRHSVKNLRRMETCVKYASIEMFLKCRKLHGARLRKRIEVNSPVEKSLGKLGYIFIINSRLQH